MNSAAENAAMAPPAPDRRAPSALLQRILSAAVLAPLAIACLWYGGTAFAVLAGVAALCMIFEWETVSFGRFGARAALAGAGIAVAVILAALGRIEFAFVAVIATAGASLMFALLTRAAPAWALAGPLYVGLPTVALIALRAEAGNGFGWTLWLFIAIWGTDIGAYVAGRSIGGPKIAPRISPSKTWAGLIGGMATAAGASLLLAAYSGYLPLSLGGAALAGALVAIVGQVGDFAESAWKRHFKVKDSSRLIPGHGGVLDRVDGLVATVPLALCIAYLAGRTGAL
ncbi:phosphatidate cytidylyltransferase [Oceanibacterium hippocampi]|uniref:Phosphatidate cytidylyltransferase n=1 Tax=Oceanibacterium hippocampi TaxID=745714 RepID=A0A1Y5T2D4_9PROT|nr:phosphatidate cytidylyltransferase [Oceanibacterium hippocampi]SLN54021.1 Phosphatidate cytidylyltransferase [Oceanibacterium hippocampi]